MGALGGTAAGHGRRRRGCRTPPYGRRRHPKGGRSPPRRQTDGRHTPPLVQGGWLRILIEGFVSWLRD